MRSKFSCIMDTYTEYTFMPKSRPNDDKNTERGKIVHKHKSKTHINTDKNRFFHEERTEQPHATQTTTVTINIEQEKDDCLTGCFDLLKSCTKK